MIRPPGSVPDLSVVVPAFNEQAGIADCIRQLTAYLDRAGMVWEILVVDDGSEDRTVAIVSEIAERDRRVRLVAAGHRGKGAAVRRGMLEAAGAWRFMADADLSMPPDNIGRFVEALRDSPVRPHVLLGSREAAGARRYGEPWYRHVAGRLFNWAVQAAAVPGIRDTQCGFKLFSAEATNALFPHATLDGFAFDVELLFLARCAGFRIHEVGIEWFCRRDSRLDPWRGAIAFADILRVRRNARQGRYLEVPSPPEHEPADLGRVCC
jgi:dolichyl-phosphate beta-glucosyltransferase